MTRREAVDFLCKTPYKFGHLLGFNKLKPLHNSWIIDMVCGIGDKTLQAHRGSYKTTCVSIALAVIAVIFPNEKTMFLRKTDDDIKEVIAQVKNILQSPQMQYFVNCIYDVNLKLTKDSADEISTNLSSDIRGTSQIVARGIGGSMTGKHFDRVFTDDIVNMQDRISRAEREHTKLVYQELRNIVNRGGRIYNTGTPWHKDDAFSLMPNPEKWDCYSTGLISAADLSEIKGGMTPSLFSANYELRHIAAEDVIFESPQVGGDPAMVEQGESHVDAAYGGEDYTAFTVCRKVDGVHYVYGRLWQKHVDDVTDEIVSLHANFNAGRIRCENNGDKGYLAKTLRGRGMRVLSYHEDMNKYLKITSYLKAAWKSVVFVAGTDQEYIEMITDYNENAEHDDAPDSLASLIRDLWAKKDSHRDRSNLEFL